MLDLGASTRISVLSHSYNSESRQLKISDPSPNHSANQSRSSSVSRTWIHLRYWRISGSNPQAFSIELGRIRIPSSLGTWPGSLRSRHCCIRNRSNCSLSIACYAAKIPQRWYNQSWTTRWKQYTIVLVCNRLLFSCPNTILEKIFEFFHATHRDNSAVLSAELSGLIRAGRAARIGLDHERLALWVSQTSSSHTNKSVSSLIPWSRHRKDRCISLYDK